MRRIDAAIGALLLAFCKPDFAGPGWTTPNSGLIQRPSTPILPLLALEGLLVRNLWLFLPRGKNALFVAADALVRV